MAKSRGTPISNLVLIGLLIVGAMMLFGPGTQFLSTVLPLLTGGGGGGPGPGPGPGPAPNYPGWPFGFTFGTTGFGFNFGTIGNILAGAGIGAGVGYGAVKLAGPVSNLIGSGAKWAASRISSGASGGAAGADVGVTTVETVVTGERAAGSGSADVIAGRAAALGTGASAFAPSAPGGALSILGQPVIIISGALSQFGQILGSPFGQIPGAPQVQ